ncbi:MAG TPA: AAA family ATPase [Polyangia bacterium]|nr:AAA family ATPase [Polyangia bacterium]
MRRQAQDAAPPPRDDRLQIRLLGELELARGGRTLVLPASKKTRALLAYLCATGRAQRRDALCELLWDGPDDPRAALRWSLTKIRPLLDPGGDGSCRLVTDRERVEFQAAPEVVDLWQVRTLMAAGIDEAATDRLRAAAGQFRGPFLEGLELGGCHRFAAWWVGEREALRGAHVAILSALVGRLADAAPGEALGHARALVTLDPLVESSHVTVVRLLAAMGRVPEAIEQYDRCRRILDGELGVRPSHELEQLRMSLSFAARSPVARARGASEAPAPAPAVSAIAEPALLPLIGRDAERAAIAGLLDEVQAGRGREVLLVLGDPGVGKTRVLDELRLAAARRRGRVLYGRAYEAELARPCGALVDALRAASLFADGGPAHAALAPLLPEAGPGARGGDRHQLFEAVATFLRDLASARQPSGGAAPPAPLVLILDDIQWLDEASAGLLHYLARTLAGTPLLLAAAARAGELADNAAALRLVRGLDQDRRLRRLSLAPLDDGAIVALVRAALPGVDAARAVADSGGNPLFALEVARSQAAGAGPGSATLPGLIGERLERLGEPGRRVLPWAAALGRSFDAELLGRVSALPTAELLDALGVFERHGVMRAAGGGSYDFVHDLIRQAAYRQMSEPRRRLVHLQIARALAARPGAGGALAGDVAHHAGLGGDHALAAEACLRAAGQCLRLYAHAESAEVASRGLVHASHLPREERLRLEIALLGRLAVNPHCRGLRGREVAAALSRAVLEAREAGLEPDAAVGLYARSLIEYSEGRLGAAYETTVEAAVQRRASDPSAAAEHMSSMAKCLIYIEKDVDRAETMIAEAQGLAGAHGQEIQSLLAASGMMRHFLGESGPALDRWRLALALARRREDRWEECECLMRISLIALETGDAPAALREAATLLEAARRMGEGTELAVAETLAALARYALEGDEPAPAEVANGLERAIATLREIDAKGLLALALNLAAEIDFDAGRAALAYTRAAEALAAALAVERWSQAALARAVLARLAAAAGDRGRAASVLAPLAPHLSQRLGVSDRARRAAAIAYTAIDLPMPGGAAPGTVEPSAPPGRQVRWGLSKGPQPFPR